MLIGYARVSTIGQNLEAQIEHLQAEGWYNPKRRHSALGIVSPMKYEENYHAQMLPSGSNKLSTKTG